MKTICLKSPQPRLSAFLANFTRYFVGLVFLTIFSGTAFAQSPWSKDPTNLKVLPEGTSTQELRAAMIGFSSALGVRCVHCHVAENVRDFSTYDFAADDKESKQTARIMIKMVQDINQGHLAQIAKSSGGEVQCATCHAGRELPRTLDRVLSIVAASDGVDAAITRYRELREKYYGRGAYDFGENALNAFGYELLGKDQLADATRIFELNVEMNPDGANPQDSLAEVYMKAGKKELAIKHYSKSLELNPRNRNAAKMLEKLKGE